MTYLESKSMGNEQTDSLVDRTQLENKLPVLLAFLCNDVVVVRKF